MEQVPISDRDTVEVIDGVHLTQLAAGDRMSIQHVRMEPGAVVPAHDHHHEQIGFTYQGAVTFVLADGREVDVGVGESYALEGGEIHGAENRGEIDALCVDIFGPPRPNPDWLE